MKLPMPDRYYNLPAWLAWCLSSIGAIGAGVLMNILFSATDTSAWYWLLGPFLLPPVVLLSTPLMRVTGIYKYYSPLFLTFGEKPERYEIHSGPGIDYLLHLRGVKPGAEMKRTVLAFYLQGLLKIAEQIEHRQGEENTPKAADVNIVGTSYFFSDRSVERMGFSVSSGGWFHRLNLILNFPELTILNSLAVGKLDIPNVLQVKQAQMTGETLLEHRDYILRLYRRVATARNLQYQENNAN